MSNNNNNSEYNLAYNAIKSVEEYMENSFNKNMVDIEQRIDKLEKVNRIDYDSKDCKKNPLYYSLNKLRKTHEDVITTYNENIGEESSSNIVIINKIINMHENLEKIENEGDKND